MAAHKSFAGRKRMQKLCILTENIEYEEPHQFGYDITLGFRPDGGAGRIYGRDCAGGGKAAEAIRPTDVFMLRNNYLGAFVLGFPLNDPFG